MTHTWTDDEMLSMWLSEPALPATMAIARERTPVACIVHPSWFRHGLRTSDDLLEAMTVIVAKYYDDPRDGDLVMIDWPWRDSCVTQRVSFRRVKP